MVHYEEKDIYQVLDAAGIDPVEAGKVKNQLAALRKDTVPQRPLYDHRLYENGPFSLVDREVTSTVVGAGSPLLTWIPTQTMRSRKTRVSHLDWIAPDGFTGAETYPEWLASIEIGDCGYGPSTAWNGGSYEMDAGSFSWRTNSMKPYEDGGLRYYEEMPLIALRGGEDIVGSPVIQSDSDWAIARLLFASEQHVEYVTKHGDRSNSQMEWDGLDMINRPGYVQSHTVGAGNLKWADPIWVNGAGVSDLYRILQTVRVVVRLLRKRAAMRRWGMGSDDMIILMDSTMWANIREAIAAGALLRFSALYGFEGRIDFRDYSQSYVNTGGDGMSMTALGVMDIDGVPIPVMTDPNYGAGVTLTVDDGQGGSLAVPAVIGDIQILTRRAGGLTFWYQEYLDWANLDYPRMEWNESRRTVQGGILRTGYVHEASKCYYYFMEMVGRLVCSMLPMQGRISNVVVPLLDAMEMEQGAFFARNFYGFGGAGVSGGMGTDLLQPTP